MSHAERCPVCYGSGKYTPINGGCSSGVPQPQTCHGCGGKGWVEVGDYVWYEPLPPYIIMTPGLTWPGTGTTQQAQTNIEGASNGRLS